MGKKSGLWIALVAVLTACPSLFCCAFGAITLTGGSTYELGTQSGQISPGMGWLFLCLGLVPWLLLAGVWFFMQRRNNDTDILS